MILNFNTNGNEKQRAAVQAWTDEETLVIVYGGSKASGKSFLGINLIFGNALMYPGTMYFIARKELNDLRKFTMPSIYEVFDLWQLSSKYYRFNGLDNFFSLYNGSRVYFLAANHQPQDPEGARFGSLQFTRGWIEEAGEIGYAVKNALQITIGRCKNIEYKLKPKLLMTCNPTHNFLYHDFYKPHRDGVLDKKYKFIAALPTDNKMLAPEYLENLRITLSGAAKKRLLEGQWEYDDSTDLLTSFQAVSNAIIKKDSEEAKNLLKTKATHLSADVALLGRDKFVVFSWRWNCAVLEEVHVKIEAKNVQTIIETLQKRLGISVYNTVADADGLGSYLGSYIRGIRMFHAEERAVHPKLYKGMKTECAYDLARLLNDGKFKIICGHSYVDVIAEELMQLRCVDPGADSANRLIRKDDMKEKLGRSPDFLDALIMGRIWYVKEQASGIKGVTLDNYGKYSEDSK